MSRRIALTLALVLAAAAPLRAQVPLLDIRVGAQAALPTGDFADAYDAGIGAYGRIGVPMLAFTLMGSATYTRFKAANPLIEDRNELTLQVGPHFNLLPMMDLGLELAYFTEAEETGFSPSISVGLLMLEATASYNTTFNSPRGSWVTLGVGLRF